MKHLAFITGLAGLASLPATAQASVSYTCDLYGLDGDLLLEYTTAGGVPPAYTPDGHLSGLVGAGGPAVSYSGKLASEMAVYTISGTSQAAELEGAYSGETYAVEFTAEGEDLVITVSPGTPGQNTYRCQRN